MLQSDNYQLLTMDSLPVPASEFQSAIRWKIKDLLHFPIDDAVVDSFPVPVLKTQTPHEMIMVVVAQASYLKTNADIIKASGLNLTTIDIPEMGLRNITALYEEGDEKSTALISMQEKSSQLIVTRQKKLYFSRRLEFGLEKIKLILSAPENQDQMDRYIDQLALEVQRSFDYYQSQWREPPAARMLLATVSSYSEEIVSHLSKRLTVPIEILNINEMLESKEIVGSELQVKSLPIFGGVLRNEVSMLQEINLYSFLPKKAKNWFSLESISWMYGAFFLLLMLYFSFEKWEEHRQYAPIAKLTAELSQAQNELAALARQYPLIDPNDSQKSIERLQHELDVQAKIVNMLLHSIKFSDYLIGIAQASVSGVWVTDIMISMSDQTINLKGYAIQAVELQQFLYQLEHQPIFAGAAFELKELTQVADSKDTTLNNYLNFYIVAKVGHPS